MVRCKVCGKNFGRINASHLKKHGMTTTDYREKYGEEGLILNHCLFVKRNYDDFDQYNIEKTIKLTMEQRRLGRKVGSHRHYQ